MPGHITRQNYNSKRYMYPYIHSSTIHNNQDVETIKVSTDRGMGKECAVHIYSGIFLNHKKNEIMSVAAT